MSLSQRGFAPILVLVLIVLGIALAVFLVQQRTNILPHASEEFAGPNLALNKPTYQSSVLYGAGPERAIDSDKENFTHTNIELRPFWGVDLGSSQYVEKINVYNRKSCCQDRLKVFYVFTSEKDFKSADLERVRTDPDVNVAFVQEAAGFPTTIPVGRNIRYLRVQLTDENYLSLGEVEVLGKVEVSPLPSATIIGDNFSPTPHSSVDTTSRCSSNSDCPAGYTCESLSTCNSSDACTQVEGKVCFPQPISSPSPSAAASTVATPVGSPVASAPASSGPSNAPSGSPVSGTSGDFNGDGNIDFIDLSMQMSHFGTHEALYDLDRSGTVDRIDTRVEWLLIDKND